MTRTKIRQASVAFVLTWGLIGQVVSSSPMWAAGDEAFARQAAWQMVSPAQAKERLTQYLQEEKVPADLQEKALANWPTDLEALSRQDLLDSTMASLAVIEPRLEEVRAWCSALPATTGMPEFAILKDETTPAFVRANTQLYLARTCVQRDYADECLDLLSTLNPEEVVDPAGLLFHRAVAHHRLLQKEECLKDAKLLLEHEADVPARYARLSHLMADDIGPLKKDSLDEVSRMMEDVRRRLDHARAGTKVRDEEEEIIAKLDKMIEKLEEQQKQQQQQQQAGQAGGKSPSNPAQDSNPAELKAPGEVDIKDIGKKDGWGNLPAKERQEVLQQIGKELPAHFRETIEEYFQRLAQDGVK